MAEAEGGRSGLRLGLLGEFRLFVDGFDRRPRSRKACGLLAYLALAAGKSASREKLADLLWSDRGTEQARGSLRQALAEIRGGHAAIGDALDISRDAVRYAPGHPVCDIEQICEAAEHRDGAGLAHALEATGDQFLADCSGLSPAFDEWLLAERVRQHGRVLAVVLDALPAMTGTARPVHIQAIVRALDRLDPWNEAVARLGMQADHAAGDFASLHRRYRALVTGITEEFQADPSAETQALYRTLSASKDVPPVTQPAAPVAPAPVAPTTMPPTIFVGAISALGTQPHIEEIAAIITDDLRTALARHRELRVLSLEASDLARVEQACANALAAYMLTGRVRQVGSELRVNLQIGNIHSSTITWSEQIMIDPADLAGAIDHVVARAAGAVFPTIERDIAQTPPSHDMGTRDDVMLYAEARRLIGRGHSLPDVRAGAAILEDLVARDAHHVGARMLLARMYNTDYWQSAAGHDVAALRGRALELNQEAAALDPADASIQLRLAWCHLRQGNWLRAERGFRQAMNALPFDADTLNVCAFGLCHLGETDLAEPLMQRAFLLNPFPTPDYHADYATIAMLRDDPEVAEEHFEASGEQGLQYLALRLANLTRLPSASATRSQVRTAFESAFRNAWQPDRRAVLDDVLDWADYTFPLRQQKDRALVREGVSSALGAGWRA
jgi:DNA-binding SARP family transcriptional activator/TolB-like protein